MLKRVLTPRYPSSGSANTPDFKSYVDYPGYCRRAHLYQVSFLCVRIASRHFCASSLLSLLSKALGHPSCFMRSSCSLISFAEQSILNCVPMARTGYVHYLRKFIEIATAHYRQHRPKVSRRALLMRYRVAIPFNCRVHLLV